MLDIDGYLSLSDLNTAKKLTVNKRFRTKTIIGTPEYMAPEIVTGKGYTFTVDLWSLGIFLYEFLCSKVPFGEGNDDPFLIYDEIKRGRLEFPLQFPKSTKLLIVKLLDLNPQKRIGTGFEELKKHPFFTKIDFKSILDMTTKSPIKPEKSNEITP